MRAVIQRVKEANVEIGNTIVSTIGKGLLILLGIEDSDKSEDVLWLSKKISSLRIFNDENDIMNLSVADIEGELLVVSQFTLHAKTKKGNRPSYINAARPEQAIPLYEEFVLELEKQIGKSVQTGEFGAMMDISLVNFGPVTIVIDTKKKE